MSQKFKSELELEALNNASTDTDKFLVSDNGIIKYRTGIELLNDINGQSLLTNPITGTGTPNYLSKFTGSGTLGNSQIFDNGTNVGIGTTNPSTNLHILGNASRISPSVRVTHDVGFVNQSIEVIGSIFDRGGIVSVDEDANLIFKRGLSESMRINGSGNVGIGTTSPQARLDVRAQGDLATDVVLRVRNSTDTQDFLVVNGAGDVGIGTTSPSTNLHVLGNSFSVNPSARITHDPGFSPEFIELSAGAFAGGGIISVGSTSSIIFRRDSNESMRIDGAGNVGIGTSSPSTRFYVKESTIGETAMTVQVNESISAGAVLIDFKNNGGSTVGSIYYNGSSTNYNTSSDYRLKENVVKIDGALERLKLLKPVNFNFINSPERIVDGFIAHEVQEVIPEAVTGKKDELDKYGNPKYQGIDQSKIVPLLTAALQEAVMKINELEKRIQNIENNK